MQVKQIEGGVQMKIQVCQKSLQLFLKYAVLPQPVIYQLQLPDLHVFLS